MKREQIVNQMKNEGIRAELDGRTESIGKKVRDAQLDKVNYILVVGEREQKDKTVTIRTFHNKKMELTTKSETILCEFKGLGRLLCQLILDVGRHERSTYV